MGWRDQVGQGDCPLESEYPVRRLDITGLCKTTCGEHGVGLWCKVDALFWGLGSWEPEIEWGRGIDPQSTKIKCVSSIFIWAWNFQLVRLVRTHRVMYSPYLSPSVHEVVSEFGGTPVKKSQLINSI
jgi:hypothetical protein